MNGQNDKKDKLVLSRVSDAVDFARNKYLIKAVGFLNPYQRSLVYEDIKWVNDCKCVFDGGYPDAERTMLICCPEYDEYDINEIISVVRISGRATSELSHRDYLGSLMGLGITRENIGDIIVSDDGALLFVKSEIASYIVQNLTKIGRCGIKTEVLKCSAAELPKPKLKLLKGTVSSERLDAIVAFAAGVSRNKACEMIESGLVSVNWKIAESVSAKVTEMDLLSVRGIGRVRITKLGGLTKKGRLSVEAEKFE